MREAAVRAQLGLATTDDESIKADSLAVMEEAMSFFYRLALKEKRRNEEADLKAIRDNMREAVIIVRIPTKSAGDSERKRPPVPIEAGRAFR